MKLKISLYLQIKKKGLIILKKKMVAILFIVVLIFVLFAGSFSCFAAIQRFVPASAPKDIIGEIYVGDTDVPCVSFTWTNVDLTKNTHIKIERANTTFFRLNPTYDIIRDNEDNHANSYFDRTVVTGNKYSYKFYGVNAFESAVSSTYTIYIPTVTVLGGSSTTNSIKLNWTSDSKITDSISLYRYTDADPQRVLLASFPTTTKSYIDTSIKAGTEYYYYTFTHKNQAYNIQSNTIKASTNSTSVSTVSNVSSSQVSSKTQSTSSLSNNSSKNSTSSGSTVSDSQANGNISSSVSSSVSKTSSETVKVVADAGKTNISTIILIAIGSLILLVVIAILVILLMKSKRKV